MARDERTEQAASVVIDAALHVHRALGPGLLESTYERALSLELSARHIPFVTERVLYVSYRGETIRAGRADFVVDDRVLVELKCVSALEPVHVSQVIAYLRAAGLRLGLLINFNVPAIRLGIRRIALSAVSPSGARGPKARVEGEVVGCTRTRECCCGSRSRAAHGLTLRRLAPPAARRDINVILPCFPQRREARFRVSVSSSSTVRNGQVTLVALVLFVVFVERRRHTHHGSPLMRCHSVSSASSPAAFMDSPRSMK
jgi:GxxExxY protein